MSNYDYVYKEVGLLSPLAMAIMGVLVLCLAFALVLIVRNRNGKIHMAGDRWNTIRSLIKQNYVGKYSNSYIGIVWYFLMPVLLAVIICYVFMSIKDLYPGRNYGVYICAGFFVAAVCRHSLTGGVFKSRTQVIRKTSAPGWVIVLADTLSQFTILVVALITTLILRLALGDPFVIGPTLSIVILLAILFIFSFGCSLLFSTLSVIWEDIGQIASLLARIIVWVSPVFFYLSSAKSTLEDACMWNPFTYFIEPFHQALSYGVMPNTMLVLTSLLVALLTLFVGLLVNDRYFDKVREQI